MTQARTARSHRTKAALKDLQTLPGIGPSIAGDLYDLGYRSAAELASADPEKMYARHCRMRGMVMDRCVLYAYRCAVYASRTRRPSRELLLWWNWKDRDLPPRARKRR